MRKQHGKQRVSRIREEDTRRQRLSDTVDEEREGASQHAQSTGRAFLPFLRVDKWLLRNKRVAVGIRISLDKVRAWIRGS